MPHGLEFLDDHGQAIQGWDSANARPAIPKILNPVQDPTTGVVYGDISAGSNPNGQTTSNASAPVVIASDQTPVAVKGSATGGAVPAQAFYIGIRDFSGNLDGINSIGSLGNSGAGIDGMLPVGIYGYVGSAVADMLRVANISKNVAAVAITAATPVTIWTPTSGKKFRVMGFAFSLTVAGSIILKDNTTEFLRTPTVGAGLFFMTPPIGNGYLSVLANNTLKLDVTATGSVSGFVYGTEE